MGVENPLSWLAGLCGVVVVVTAVMGVGKKDRGLAWFWATIVFLGLGLMLVALGADPRDGAFQYGRTPVLLAGLAAVLAGLLVGANVLGERGVIPRHTSLHDVLAATLCTVFFGITLILARAGERPVWFFAAIMGLVSLGIWTYALRKLLREFRRDE